MVSVRVGPQHWTSGQQQQQQQRSGNDPHEGPAAGLHFGSTPLQSEKDNFLGPIQHSPYYLHISEFQQATITAMRVSEASNYHLWIGVLVDLLHSLEIFMLFFFFPAPLTFLGLASGQGLMTYKLIPDSGKMVVFDSRLQILDALNGLLHHDINCAPVWDSVGRHYIGMLTVSDYIDILRHAHISQDPAAMDENRRICDWQAIKRVRGTSIDRLLCISPESSLYEAAEMLTRYRVHRLCVLQNGALANTVLSILSQHAILGYMLSVVS